MSKKAAHALMLVVLGNVLAACGSAGPSRPRAASLSAFQRGGFVVQPAAIADQRCGGGHGVELPARAGSTDSATAASLPDGSTLIAHSAGERTLVLYSITPDCRPDASFGQAGFAKVSLPSGLRGKSPVYLGGVAPRSGGGAILFGQYGGKWVVGEITGNGRLDHRFGGGGWRVLPIRGVAYDALQEPSGLIVMAGGTGAGCCVRNWAAAVSATGRLDRSFGTRGRTTLPTGVDSGVSKLALEPNGDILAEVGWGNSGCWGVTPAMLTPAGQPVRHFRARFERFWRGLDLQAFAGDVYVTGNGFVLAGTGQKPCAGMPSLASAPSAHGLLARFRTNGTEVGRTVRFPSRMQGIDEVQRLDRGRAALFVEAPYADETKLRLVAVRTDGSFDTHFGHDGHALVRTPWRGADAARETMVAVVRGGTREIVLLADHGDRRMQLIRLRY